MTPFGPTVYVDQAESSARSSGQAQLKSRKSLHKRLEEGDGQLETSSKCVSPGLYNGADGMRPDHGHGNRTHKTPHSYVRSRSGSVVSSVYGRPAQDDDISSIMIAGAAEIRNAKYETEEQARTYLPLPTSWH